MLENLSIKNIALIDNLFTEFEPGFNVLSGETGAGKSILINAISVLLGSKNVSGLIRNGENEASVSASFFVAQTHKAALAWLNERNIELENGRVFIRRTLKPNGRTSAWIQNTSVSRSELEEFTSFLLDIHGQHDHQSLFKVSEHRRFLDCFAEIEDKVKEFTALYTELAEKRSYLKNINDLEKEESEKLQFLTFALEEIEKANLKVDEEESLVQEEKKLTQFEKLYELTNSAYRMLSDEHGIVPILKKVNGHLLSAGHLDQELIEYSDRCKNCFYELEDISGSLSSYISKLTFSPDRLDAVQERLSLIYKLEKKYGSSIEKILEYKNEIEDKIGKLSTERESKAEIEKQIKVLEAKIVQAGRIISQKRKEAAKKLQEQIETILADLGMGKARFCVSVITKELEGDKQTADPYGFDETEFLITANPGEPLKPLTKIASGGELSRVMLALKTVLSQADEADTLIFDEIDTGIGGEVALSVAAHMKKLSKKKQILCITHLAVIASHADTQIKIEKSSEGGLTHTSVYTVLGEKRVEEIARMLAGDELSEASLIHASELLRRYSNMP